MESMYLKFPAGTVVIRKGDKGIIGIRFSQPQNGKPARTKDRVLNRMKNDVRGYFRDPQNKFNRYTLDYQKATDFQKTVWKAAGTIPAGKTETYSGVARMIGRPRAARAVGTALGRNPFLLMVPCHRVVGSNGSLGGFSAGLKIKKWLLLHEGVIKRKSQEPRSKLQTNF